LEQRRVSDDALTVVNGLGCLFIQFSTFTYLRVGYYHGYPYMLPKFPSDKIVLIELCWKMIIVHNKQMELNKPGFRFPIEICRYFVAIASKAKAKEIEMQLVTMKQFRNRPKFDYWGVKDKIKRNTQFHEPMVEDI